MSLLEELKSDRVDELAERADTRETIDRLRDQLSDQRAYLLRAEAKLADIDIAIAALEGEPAPLSETPAVAEDLIGGGISEPIEERINTEPAPHSEPFTPVGGGEGWQGYWSRSAWVTEPAPAMIEDPLSDPPLYSADAAALPAETAGLDEDELVLDQPAEREDA